MFRAILAIACMFASPAFAECDAIEKFAAKWKVDPRIAIIHTTTDVTTKQPVNVFDLGKEQDPHFRYAVTWYDEPTCTVEAIFGDLPYLLLTMEMSVYDYER